MTCLIKLYLDIDGVLLDYDSGGIANGAVELLEYITKEFDCYWLTTHCKGGQRHYLLANVALVGEAITLAMRTAVKW
jgi:hypothetical protein